MANVDIITILLVPLVGALILLIWLYVEYMDLKERYALKEKLTLGMQTPLEIQSGIDRIKMAENLIRYLSTNDTRRNTWLMNYGTSKEAVALRKIHRLSFDDGTKAAVNTNR